MRHIKQYHSPAQVLIEHTPAYPYTQAYLYKDDDYAKAAQDRLVFCYPTLKKQPRLSDELWFTSACDEMVVLNDGNGNVTVMTIMAKTFESLRVIVSHLENAKIQGERLSNWYSPNQLTTVVESPSSNHSA